jgi:hypothetical protein
LAGAGRGLAGAGGGFAGAGVGWATAYDTLTAASMTVAVSAANTLLAVRSFADIVRYVIFVPLFPPVLHGAALRAPIACLDALKKAGA